MIEFSLGKLVLLALIALIVLGPEKLPGAARTAGALLRRVRSGWDDVRAEVERELEVEQIRRAAREAAAQAEAAQQEVKDGLRGVREPLTELVSEVAATSPPHARQVTDATDPAEPEEVNPQAELPLGEPVSGEPAAGEPASPTRNAAHDNA
ncbi:MAG: twin-arginine translocase subunit TatB [Rhodanobacter sp.]|nr:MAG: twin-arginine translocase subunit TatB [Rhodanobacter sp.]TAM42278.1 MAG: twin-arginine translocase subunit TatB [Rhodanobacter sp.]